MEFTTLIDVDSLRALIGKPGIAVLDCRFDLASPEAGRQAYRRGHIPGARYLDLNRDLSAPVSPVTGRHPLPDRQALTARLAAAGVSEGSQAIVYDESNGSFAARAWWLMRSLGHRQVAVLDGGITAWQHAGGPVESGEPECPVATHAPRDSPTAPAYASVLSSRELIAALEDSRTLLIDARAPERFAGTVEPIDPVAGHIPGAVNHPFGTNLRPDGRFLAPEELERRWRDRLGDRSPADVIVMCGSGVTACHNLLALEHAGLPGARLYAGSWSEWIRDPRRPIERA